MSFLKALGETRPFSGLDDGHFFWRRIMDLTMAILQAGQPVQSLLAAGYSNIFSGTVKRRDWVLAFVSMTVNF